MRDLGSLGGNLGFRGFLWENGGPMVDLNALVVNGVGIRLLGPATINERGEMAVPGIANGDVRGYLLIPCDDDHPAVEACDYSMADVSITVAQTTPAVRDI